MIISTRIGCRTRIKTPRTTTSETTTASSIKGRKKKKNIDKNKKEMARACLAKGPRSLKIKWRESDYVLKLIFFLFWMLNFCFLSYEIPKTEKINSFIVVISIRSYTVYLRYQIFQNSNLSHL